VPPADAARALQQVLQSSRRRIVARLAGRLGLDRLALADDALQGACLQALSRWPQQGVPANPAGWLYRVARHRAIDGLRVAGRHEPWPEDDDEAAPWAATPAPTSRLAGELDDDELVLLFACCHPALPPAQQVALALRLLTGLELAPIAQVLLCTEAALAQRLARGREALAALARAEAGWAAPSGAQLPPRRDAVLGVLALAFHAGARARARGQPAGAGLCWEAIRLARALAAHPAIAHPDADALAALLLLHGARLTGAVDDDGLPVPLAGQARDRWDAGLVRLGLAHLQAAQQARRLSRWHLLAAVAAEHAVAPSVEATRWTVIVRCYETLLRLDDTAAPRLAHAIALAEAGDAASALERLAALEPAWPSALAAHARAAQARAHERLGQVDEALRLLHAAAEVAPHAADAGMLRRRAAALAAACGGRAAGREGR
jgi:RNA polymerase sigma-70 factor (ECF subfamily)